MLVFKYVVIALCIPLMLFGQTEDSYMVEWSKSLSIGSGGALEAGNSIAVDTDGNIYVVGLVRELLSDKFFIAKYDNQGEFQWSRTSNILGDAEGLSVIIDSTNSIIIAGTTTSGGAGGKDVFVTSYTPLGDLHWIYSFGTDGDDEGKSITIDKDDNLYVTGTTTSAFPQETNIGGIDTFIAKILTDGSQSWIKQFGTNSDDEGVSIAIDGNNNLYIVGTTYGVFPEQTDGDRADVFIAKYSIDGVKFWIKQNDISLSDKGKSIAIDSNNNLFVTGSATIMTPFIEVVGFIAKYSSDGVLQWSEHSTSSALPSDRSQSSKSIIIDKNDNPVVAGYISYYTYQAGFGGVETTAHVSTVVQKYNNADGSRLSWRTKFNIGSLRTFDFGNSISIDNDGNLFVTGKTVLVMADVAAYGSANAFIAKLSPNIAPVANAGDDISILIKTSATLDGSSSSDPDEDDPLTYVWTFISQPEGSEIVLSEADASSLTFTPVIPGDYNISLVVTDARGGRSNPDTVIVTANNTVPVANAGSDQSGVVGDVINLDGSGSFDTDDHTLTYSWSLVKPSGSNIGIINSTSHSASFTPDVSGTYEASLIVHDGYDYSSSASSTITVIPIVTAATDTVEETIAAITEMDPGIFSNPNIGNALTNKLNSILDLINDGEYQQALDKLNNDILPKTDGCALRGEADKQDWIEECIEQEEVYEDIMDIIGRLESLL